MKMSARHIQAVLLLLSSMALFTPTFPSGQAHPMTFATLVSTQLWANGASQRTVFLYDDLGPSDKTWVIRFKFGLDGGDNVQYSRFDVSVIDNGIIAEVATYRAGADDWVQNGACCWLYGATITAHISGTMDVLLTIHNPDAQGQMFHLFYRAAYI